MNPSHTFCGLVLTASLTGCALEPAAPTIDAVDTNLALSSLSAAESGDAARCHVLLPEDLHLEVNSKTGNARAMGRHMFVRGSTASDGSLVLTGLLKEEPSIPGESSTSLRCKADIGTDHHLSMDCHVVKSRIDDQGEPVETLDELDCQAKYEPLSPADEALPPTGSDLLGSYIDYGEGSTEQAVDNSDGDRNECRLAVGRLKVSIEGGELIAADRASMKGKLPDTDGRSTVEGKQCYVGMGKRFDEQYRCDLHFFYLAGVPHVDEHCVARVDIYDGQTDVFEQTLEDDCHGLAKKMP